MNKIISIYALTDPFNLGIRYVGVTSLSIHQRLILHNSSANKNSNLHVHCWIRKIKFKAHPILLEIVPKNRSWQKAEQKWIAYYRAKGAKLCNHTDGGEGTIGMKMSESSKLKISKLKKKWMKEHKHPMLGKKHKRESLLKMSDASKGNCYALGVKKTTAQLKQMSDSRMGHKVSEATKIKISEFQKGKQWRLGHKSSKATKKKLSKRMKGNHYADGNQNCLGHYPSMKTRLKMSRSQRRRFRNVL